MRAAPLLKVQFFCGDATIEEMEVYTWEGDYFEKETLRELDILCEKRKLESKFGCKVSVKTSQVHGAAKFN